MIIICIAIILIIVFIINFYRTPESRSGSFLPTDILAASYGTIYSIEEAGCNIRIVVFLSPLDVHMQYCPTYGVVERSVYDRTGKFHLAYKLGKSRLNEKRIHRFRTDFGPIEVVQVAGFLTRRIDSWITEGQSVAIGQPLGFIHLGSRVDMLIPRNKFTLTVAIGDKLQGGRQRIGFYTK